MGARLFFYTATFITAIGSPLVYLWEGATVSTLWLLCGWTLFTITHIPSVKTLWFTMTAGICLSLSMFAMLLLHHTNPWVQLPMIMLLFGGICAVAIAIFTPSHASSHRTWWLLGTSLGVLVPAVWIGAIAYGLAGFCIGWASAATASLTSIKAWEYREVEK